LGSPVSPEKRKNYFRGNKMITSMLSTKGNPVPNQFIIKTEDSEYFQSYETIIAQKKNDGTIILSPEWNYSRTTSKYRAIFLKESTAETLKKVKNGVYTIKTLEIK
jgi:hypothetical protein